MLLEHIAGHADAIDQINADLNDFAQRDARSKRYINATGIGALTPTASA